MHRSFHAPGALGWVLLAATAAQAQHVGLAPHSTDPMDWIIQHVCADHADRPVPADPYAGCPAGTTQRRLAIGDPFPYLRHDQPGRDGDHPDGFQRHDAYPIRDLRYGGVVAANDFDFDYRTPYGRVEAGDGDGYDVYRVADGWVTAGDTRDGSGYSQSFFGAACKPYGGWNFFPVDFLKQLAPQAAGEAAIPIRGSYWEQNGEPWPGSCRPGERFSEDTLTTWQFEQDHPFGGVNGAAAKRIDTIVSTHGFPVHPWLQPNFHLERFYFTDLYGVTRWEAWSPASDNAPANGNCAGPQHMTYRGTDFTLADCRDWSVVAVNRTPQPRFPWPYPESNLLLNAHFDGPDLAPWNRSDAAGDQGRVLNWSQATSVNRNDTRYSVTHVGVRYLAIDCGGSCGADQAIFQDVAVSALPRTGQYDYGFSAMVEGEAPGKVKVALMQLDAEDRPLATTSFVAEVPAVPNGPRSGSSIYKGVRTVLTTSPAWPLRPNAKTMRFAIYPLTPADYLVMDTWLMPR